jgi:hypothetical protein
MIENHLAYNVRDIEFDCPEDCPRLKELEEKYEEILADWEADKESWKRNYPDEELPDDLKEPPEFPECNGCEYELLKKEEEQFERARFFGND